MCDLALHFQIQQIQQTKESPMRGNQSNSIKSLLLSAAMVLCVSAWMGGTARAQDPPQPGQMQGPPPGGMRGGSPERRAGMLQKQLGLTDDVTAQVKAIFTAGTARMEALRADTSMEPDARRTQMMAIHTDEVTKVKALLTPDQQTKYAEIEARPRRGPGGPPPDGNGPPPPPQQ